MIDVKISFATFAALAAFAAKNADTPLMLAETGQASAMVTPDKQQAARDSTAAGKVEKAAKAEKAAKDAAKPADAKPNPETPIDGLVAAVTGDAKPAPRVYETSGIPDKVSKAVTTNRDAVVALLEQFKAKKDGKLSAKFLAVEHFDEFEKGIDAILAPADDLG